MRREHAIDVIRAALHRQKERDPGLSLVQSETPDSFHVIGVIDVHAIAEAIEEASRYIGREARHG